MLFPFLYHGSLTVNREAKVKILFLMLPCQVGWQ
ncbi:hypothetical protein PANA5342_pPANA10317 (plasmid) [Pantoea ananatis LMG 5342]|nr:hypothetical protein PANA5342_pPANA10317 [Pantoea ananatis LMG 5342]